MHAANAIKLNNFVDIMSILCSKTFDLIGIRSAQFSTVSLGCSQFACGVLKFVVTARQ